MNSRRRAHRAFTLIELLYSLTLLAIAGLIAARLFGSTMRVIASAPQSQEQRACLDRMSDVLRHDVWGATKMTSIDEQSIELAAQNGATIRWAFGPDGATRSASDGQVVRWNPQIKLHPRASGGILVLTCPDVPLEQLRFASQVIRAEESK